MLHHHNDVRLSGRAGDAPGCRLLTDGTFVANLRLYVPTASSPGDPAAHQPVRVVAWGATARLMARNVRKGTRLSVCGHLRNRTFRLKDQTHIRTEVHVTHFRCHAPGLAPAPEESEAQNPRTSYVPNHE